MKGDGKMETERVTGWPSGMQSCPFTKTATAPNLGINGPQPGQRELNSMGTKRQKLRLYA